MSRAEASELLDLALHWDTAYKIDYNGDVFSATRIGEPAQVLTGDSPWALRLQIREDYLDWGHQLAQLLAAEQPPGEI
jgi:hypothetical protein